jgi:hypothetical protein
VASTVSSGIAWRLAAAARARGVTSLRPIRGAAVTAVLVTVLSLCFVGCGSTTTAGGSARAAADFSGVTLDGTSVSLSGYRGKPLVLAFMASG